MKKLVVAMVMALNISGSLLANEIQTITRNEAYQLFLQLPGLACQEYRASSYIVLTKYQTKDCREEQVDTKKWNCTVQFELKNGKTSKVLSADCTRDL